MTQRYFLNYSLLCFALTSFFIQQISSIQYPEVRRDENIADDYHGTRILDPYRWLEDLHSEETKLFVKEQNDVTDKYLAKFSLRNEIRDSYKVLWNFTQTEAFRKNGNRYFYGSKQGGQNQCVYYYRNSFDGPALVALDPNTFSEDGTASIAYGSLIPSNDGQLLSYGISYDGVDWYMLHFKNISSGEVFPEVLTDIKLSDILWTPNNKGVIYARYDSVGHTDESTRAVKKHQNLYYHKIGTNQSDDILLVEFPKNLNYLVSYNTVRLSADGKYLVMTPYNSSATSFVWYAHFEEFMKNEFTSAKPDIKPLDTKGGSFIYQFLTNRDSTLYFLTNKDASNRRIVSIDLNSFPDSQEPKPENWKVVVPEDEHYLLNWATVVNKDVLVFSYLKDVKSSLQLRHLVNGSVIKDIPLENGFLTDTFLVYPDTEGSEFFFQFQSYLSPGKTFRLNFENKDLEPELVSENIISGFNASEYKASQVFYNSHDGTKIPMYILHKNDYIPQGNSPCFLYAYGGYGTNLFYKFVKSFAYFLLSFNGIVALPSIRGGGEYGHKWHEAGKRHNKQNSYDDVVAAAEYLIQEKHTEPSKLSIYGISHGGLMVTVTINQRPDLFGAAVAQAGLMDMMRYHLTDLKHIIDEYGLSSDEEDFKTLIKYSPLHNVKLPANESIQYPATFVTAGDKDDRVYPFHSYKIISELQYKIGQSKRQTNPLMLKVYHNTGHGTGTPTSAIIEETADMFSFIAESLQLNVTNNWSQIYRAI